MSDPLGLVFYDGLRVQRASAHAFRRWSDKIMLFILFIFAAGLLVDASMSPAREHLPIAMIMGCAALGGFALGRSASRRISRLASGSVVAAQALDPLAGTISRATSLLAGFSLLPVVGWIAGIVELRSPAILMTAAALWTSAALVGSAFPPLPLVRFRGGRFAEKTRWTGYFTSWRISACSVRGRTVAALLSALATSWIASKSGPLFPGGAAITSALAGFGATALNGRLSPAVSRFESFSGTPLSRHLLQSIYVPTAAAAGVVVATSIDRSPVAGATGASAALVLIALRLLHYRQMPRATAERQMQWLLVAVALAGALAPPAALIIGAARIWSLVRTDRERLWSLS